MPDQRIVYTMSLAAILTVGFGAAVGATPEGVLQEKPDESRPALVCTLSDLPKQARAGEELKVVVKVRNPGAEPVPLLDHHVEYVTSVGTGVGIAVRKAARSDGPTKARAERPKLNLPVALTRTEELEGAFPVKPADILAVVPGKEIGAGKDVSLAITLTLPREPGEYEIRGYVRSWMYFGIRNGFALVDPKEAQRVYVDQTWSAKSTILVEER